MVEPRQTVGTAARLCANQSPISGTPATVVEHIRRPWLTLAIAIAAGGDLLVITGNHGHPT